MSLVHIYPLHDMRRHVIEAGGCWCEPKIENCGVDGEGNPARIFVHSDQNERRDSRLKSARNSL